jgi:hypothetical protein
MKRRPGDEERRIRGALDRWVVRNRKCRALHRAVRDAEGDLRKAMSTEAWKLYLLLEEHINARHVEIVTAAIRITRGARAKRGGDTSA